MGPSMILGILIRAKDQASQVMSKVDKSMKGLTTSTDRAAARFQTSAKLFKGGAAAIGIGAVALGALGATVVKAAAFNDVMSEVATLVDTSAVDMDKLKASVQGLSAEYGAAPADTAKALYQTISAGVTDTADATKLLDIANKTAIGGVTDVATAVDGITTLMNSYGLSVNEAEMLSDQLFVAMKAGKTTIGELSNTIGRVSPVASALNVSTGEMLASISALTTQGIQTSEAVSGMKQVFANILKPTSEATKAWAKMTKGTELAGTAFSAATLQAEGLPKFLDMITQATGGNAESMGELFGSVEALNAVLALTGGGAEAFATTLAGMGTATGATQEAFEKRNKTMGQSLRVLKVVMDILVQTIGDELIPVFKPVIDSIADIVAAVATWISANPKVAGTIAKVAAAIGAILIVGGTLVTLLGALGMAIAGIQLGLAAMGTIGLAGLIPALVAAASAVWAFTLALLANPVFLIIAAIVALVAGIVWMIKNWDKVTAAFEVGWEFIKNLFSAGWEWIKNAFSIGLQFVLDAITWYVGLYVGAFKLIITAVTAIWEWIKNAFSVGLQFVLDAVNLYISLYVGAWNLLMGAVSAVWEFIKSSAVSAMAFVQDVFRSAVDAITGFWSGLGSAISGIFSSAVGTITNAINGLIGVMNSAITQVNKLPTVNIPKIGKIGGASFATGFEVTKTGALPPGATLHEGEVLVRSDTTRAIADFANMVSGMGADDTRGRIVDAIQAATGRSPIEAGDTAVPPVAGPGGTTIEAGAVVISFPSVTEVSEIDAEELMNRIDAALAERARRSSEGTFRGDFQPSVTS